MKRIISLCFALVLTASLFSACTSGTLVTTQRITEATTEGTTETTTETTNQTTTETTKPASKLPTEEECIKAIEEEYKDVFKEYITLSFDRYADKSPIYKIMANGIESGSLTLSSPVSPEYDGFGYITGLVVNADFSVMDVTSDNLIITFRIAALPAYVYAKLCDEYNGTLLDFCSAFKQDEEKTNATIYRAAGIESIAIVSNIKVKSLVAYGDSCKLISASIP